MSSTKWDILQARAAELQVHADRARAELEWLDRTPFGRDCTACGKHLATEGDFARHFVVTDARWLNLGECPETEYGAGLRTRGAPATGAGNVTASRTAHADAPVVTYTRS